MGAQHFVLSSEEDWHKPLAFTFDFIINTADAIHKFNVPDYLSTLKVMGRFHIVGLGDHAIPAMPAQAFVPNGTYMGASHIGNRPEMLAMLDLASKQNIKSWVQEIPISEKGCAEAVKRVYENDNVRYRFVLTNYDEVFGKRE